MIKQVAKILDKNNIKYNLIDKKVLMISIESKSGENIDVAIYENKLKNIHALTMYIPKVIDIPHNIRNKIKNYVLESNSVMLLGAFSIKKNSRKIEFSFNEFITLDGENRELLELEKIPLWLVLISEEINYLREEISKLEKAKDE